MMDHCFVLRTKCLMVVSLQEASPLASAEVIKYPTGYYVD